MAKKLEGNGMWESSRMMLPEHRQAIIEQNRYIKDFCKATVKLVIDDPLADEEE
jgi:hypothetical protein